MKYIYDPNKDKALILPIEKIKYKSSFRKEFIINSVNESRYGEEAIKAFGEIDERFKNVSEEFKNPVLRVSFGMAMGCVNLKNESYTELIYPKYTDVLMNICYYQALERTPLTNPNDLSIYEEAYDYKYNHCPKTRKAITAEEKAFVSAFHEVSDQNSLKRKTINDILLESYEDFLKKTFEKLSSDPEFSKAFVKEFNEFAEYEKANNPHLYNSDPTPQDEVMDLIIKLLRAS